MLQVFFTGPIACGLSVVSIAVRRLTFAFGEGQSKRVLAGIELHAEVFDSPDGDSSTRRHFLDHFPLFTRPGAGERPLCEIESRFETSGSFAAHLRRYLRLFAELTAFEFIYVPTASTRLNQAQTVFELARSRGCKRLTKVAEPELLPAHFRDRQLFEKHETSSFDRLRHEALRDDMDCFLRDNLPRC